MAVLKLALPSKGHCEVGQRLMQSIGRDLSRVEISMDSHLSRPGPTLTDSQDLLKGLPWGQPSPQARGHEHSK